MHLDLEPKKPVNPKLANLKIAVAQIKTQPGQIEANTDAIIKSLKEAKAEGANLVVFPELTIPGYASMDLLYNPAYVQDNREALKAIAPHTLGLTAVVGFVDQDPGAQRPGERPHLYNSAAIFKNGELVAVRDKSLLPNYSIFYEDRYFAPARERKIVDLGDYKLGVEICEDLWSGDYTVDPTTELAQQGADLIVNLSASPFHIGKLPVRYELLSETAKRNGVPMVYANLVGCYDGFEGEVVFDGRSLAANAAGEIVSEAKGFREELKFVDPFKAAGASLPTVNRNQELKDALILGIQDYFERLNRSTNGTLRTAVIGISGGIDSALVLALAAEALGSDRVIAVTLPSRFNSNETLGDAYAVCKNLGITCDTVAIEDIRNQIEGDLVASKLGTFQAGLPSIASENIQARVRMLCLMAYANGLNGVVLNTGNKTELALDNCTIYGDMVGGFSVLGDVDKDRIYDLARYINESAQREIIPNSTIDRVPSAELKPNQVDADVMGAAPQIVAPLVREIIEQQLTLSQTIEQFGGDYNPELIRSIFKKLERSEWKRRQAAPAIRVTPQAFGIGRRIPIIHGFQK